MSIERGLTAPEFERVLNSNSFQSRVNKLARFTIRESCEGGLALFKNRNSGRLTISEADLPSLKTREAQRQDHNEIVGIHEYLDEFFRDLQYDPSKLLSKQRRRDIDVGLFIHSHPTIKGEYHGRYDYLIPSIIDLEVYHEELGYSPGRIDGILVADKDETALFFYKALSNTTCFYGAIDKQLSRQKMLDLMQENGYAYSTALFSTDTGQLLTHSSEVVSEIFGRD